MDEFAKALGYLSTDYDFLAYGLKSQMFYPLMGMVKNCTNSWKGLSVV